MKKRNKVIVFFTIFLLLFGYITPAYASDASEGLFEDEIESVEEIVEENENNENEPSNEANNNENENDLKPQESEVSSSESTPETNESIVEPTPTKEPSRDEISIETPSVEETLYMFNLIGLNLNEVYDKIGLDKNNIIINYVIDETISENIVLEQSISEGEPYNVNSILTLNVSSLPLEVETTTEEGLLPDITNSFALNNELLLGQNTFSYNYEGVPNSGNLTNWDNLPYSYEYNWNNPCKETVWDPTVGAYGEHVEIHYQDENGMDYNTDIRHKMQLYCANGYVYLHIIFAKNYQAYGNGNNFMFYIDGKEVAFDFIASNGSQLANQKFSEGTHQLIVKHSHGSISYQDAKDSEAILYVSNSENINNQLEVKIPLSEFKRQNESMNLDNASLIEFFTPNLMYRRISCAGSSTFGLIIIIPILIFLGYKLLLRDRKKKNEKF